MIISLIHLCESLFRCAVALLAVFSFLAVLVLCLLCLLCMFVCCSLTARCAGCDCFVCFACFAAKAVERRPSPSDAPQGDWPCVVAGSGFTTQQRLRSPTAGILGPRPSLLMGAAKTPSQCTQHASDRARDRAPLCVQGPTAPLHTPPPTHMPKARR